MTKKFDIDIFEVLKRADKKEYDYFKNLTNKEKDAFQPWVAMRFMSASPDGFSAIQSILMTNYVLNRHFQIISKDKELFYRLMCVTGDGTYKKHHMPKPPKAKRLSPFITDLVSQINGETLDDEEVYIYLTKNDIQVSDLKELAEDLGYDKDKIKDLKKTYDKFMALYAN